MPKISNQPVITMRVESVDSINRSEKTRSPILYRHGTLSTLLAKGKLNKILEDNAKILDLRKPDPKSARAAVGFFATTIRDLSELPEQTRTTSRLLNRAIQVLVTACQHADPEIRAQACKAFVHLHQQGDTRLTNLLGLAMVEGAVRTQLSDQPTQEYAEILRHELGKFGETSLNLDLTTVKSLHQKLSQWFPENRYHGYQDSNLSVSDSLTHESTQSYSQSDTLNRALSNAIQSIRDRQDELRSGEDTTVGWNHNPFEDFENNLKKERHVEIDSGIEDIEESVAFIQDDEGNLLPEHVNEDELDRLVERELVKNDPEFKINPRLNNFDIMSRQKFENVLITKLTNQRVFIKNKENRTGYDVLDFKIEPATKSNEIKYKGSRELDISRLTGSHVLSLLEHVSERTFRVETRNETQFYTFRLGEDDRSNSPIRDNPLKRFLKKTFNKYEY